MNATRHNQKKNELFESMVRPITKSTEQLTQISLRELRSRKSGVFPEELLSSTPTPTEQYTNTWRAIHLLRNTTTPSNAPTEQYTNTCRTIQQHLSSNTTPVKQCNKTCRTRQRTTLIEQYNNTCRVIQQHPMQQGGTEDCKTKPGKQKPSQRSLT